MSTEESTVQPARTTTTQAERINAILDRLEVEIDRLYRLRPDERQRIKKAEHILVAHLAGRPSTPVVKVRITHSGNRRRFLFNSLANSGSVYTVLPVTWSCSCPDHHRRNKPCKHILAGYALMRAARRSEGCPACDGGIVRHTREMVHQETGELIERVVSVPCRRCKAGAA